MVENLDALCIRPSEEIRRKLGESGVISVIDGERNHWGKGYSV